MRHPFLLYTNTLQTKATYPLQFCVLSNNRPSCSSNVTRSWNVWILMTCSNSFRSHNNAGTAEYSAVWPWIPSMEEQKWENLPQHIVVEIFSNLKLPDRLSASLACKQWRECFHSPVLWQTFLFKFVDSIEFKYGKFLENHGQYLRRVEIHCKQDKKINRESACTLIRVLSGIKAP